MNINDSLVTDEKYPKSFIKLYLASQTAIGMLLNCVFFKFSSKKIILIAENLSLLIQLKFYMVERLKIRHSILLQCVTTNQFTCNQKNSCYFQVPINKFITVDLFLCLLIYVVFAEKLFFHNDIKSGEMRSTICSGNALFAGNKLHEFMPQAIFFCFCWKPSPIPISVNFNHLIEVFQGLFLAFLLQRKDVLGKRLVINFPVSQIQI